MDDGVQGYMDNGVDDFEEPDERYESEDEPKTKGTFSVWDQSSHAGSGMLSAV